ncbi:MAG TPA: acyl-protein synthetase [Polyangiaceae bacterium]|nr:acyl-protein synthetase [Polyangiaceae bacterium]
MSVARAASDALHARVRRFALESLERKTPGESFAELALAIAEHQRAHNPVLARLWGQRSLRFEDIPAVPADAFRLGRVACFDAAEDVARFQTSGTTGGAGVHCFRTLDTYRQLSVVWGRHQLLPAASARCTVLGLAAPFEPERRSSLGFMMQEFMREFDGRALAGDGPFDPLEPGRWLLAPGALDREALRRGAERAARHGEPVLLLATSFALSWLLDALAGERLALPPGSRVMQTGGFKGHARSLDDAALADALCEALQLQRADLIGEYGMTELSSQLYDGGFAQGLAGQSPPGQSVFLEPPWLRVTPVDPISLLPVADGEPGLACFTDLANVDSSLRILTQDLVRRVGTGVVLLGRRPGASLRGCSLVAEALADAR